MGEEAATMSVIIPSLMHTGKMGEDPQPHLDVDHAGKGEGRGHEGRRRLFRGFQNFEGTHFLRVLDAIQEAIGLSWCQDLPSRARFRCGALFCRRVVPHEIYLPPKDWLRERDFAQPLPVPPCVIECDCIHHHCQPDLGPPGRVVRLDVPTLPNEGDSLICIPCFPCGIPGRCLRHPWNMTGTDTLISSRD